MTVMESMLEQYREKHHGADPEEITVAPAALIALGQSHALGTHCQDIPVKCFLFKESDVVPNGRRLGIFAKKIGKNEVHLVSCDLV